MNKKIIFWGIWLGLLSLVPLTILPNTNLTLVAKNPGLIANLIQRFLGLTIFTLMFIQIMLGENMKKYTERFGGWIYKYHVWEGITIYILVLLHPTMFVLVNYFNKHGFDPFYVFTDICLLCDPKIEYFYTLGRISFWILTFSITVALFRSTTPFLRRHWKKFHMFNFLVFLLVGIHGLAIGTDFMQMPFFAFAIVAYVWILGIVVFKVLPKLYRSFLSWWNR